MNTRMFRRASWSVAAGVAVAALTVTAAHASSPFAGDTSSTAVDPVPSSTISVEPTDLPSSAPSTLEPATSAPVTETPPTPGTPPTPDTTSTPEASPAAPPSHDEVMRLKAQAAADARTNPAAKQYIDGRPTTSLAALYPAKWWVSHASNVADPSTAANRGVDTWRIPGNTYLFGDVNGNQQQYVQWGKAKLIMQKDGNLVLYDENGRARWDTGTWNFPHAYARFQPDGNFVVYAQSGMAIVATNTCCHSGWNLHVQEDGNMVIYAPTWVAKWATNTKH